MSYHRYLEKSFDVSLTQLFQAHLPETPTVIRHQTNLPDQPAQDAQAAPQVSRCGLFPRLRWAQAMQISVSGVVVVACVKGFRIVNLINDRQPASHDFLVGY